MNKIPKSSLKKPLVFGVLFIFLVVLCLSLTANRLVNIPAVKKKISLFIFQKTGTRIEASKFSIAVFPQPVLTIDKFNILYNTTSKLDIDHLKLTIDATQLLKRNLHIKQVILDHPHLHFSGKDTKTNKPYLNSFSFSQINTLSKAIFSKLPEDQDSIKILFKNFSSPYFNKMDGDLLLSREKQELAFNTTIDQIMIRADDFKPIPIGNYLNFGSLKIKTACTHIILTPSGRIMGKQTIGPIQLYDQNKTLVFDSNGFESNFNLTDDQQEISVLPFEINSPKAVIGISFKNEPDVRMSSLSIKGTSLEVDQIRQKALAFFKTNYIVSTLFGILQDGTIPSIDISFKSKNLNNLLKKKHLILDGRITRGRVHIPDTDLIVGNISGDAGVKNGILDIKTQTGRIQNTIIQNGRLKLDLLGFKHVPFNGIFDLDVNLPDLPPILISLLPGTLLAQELHHVKGISGRARAQLGLDHHSGTGYPDVTVTTKAFSASGRYERIPGKIDIDRIRFGYASDIVTLEDFTGTMQNSRFNHINAKIDLKDITTFDIKAGNCELDLDMLMPWLLSFEKPRLVISPIKHTAGQLNVSDLSLSGPVSDPDKWTYDFRGSAKDISASTNPAESQIEHLDCRYELSNDQYKLTDISTTLNHIPDIDSYISTDISKSLLVPIKINNGRFVNNNKDLDVSGKILFKTGTELEIKHGNRSSGPSERSWIRIKDSQVSDAQIVFHHDSGRPLFDFKGKLNTDSLKTLLIPKSDPAKKLDNLSLQQPIIVQSTPDQSTPDGFLSIHARQLDLNTIFSSSDSFDPDRLYLPAGSIRFAVDKIQFKNFTFSNVQSSASFKKDHTYIRLKQAQLCDLNFDGYINLIENMVLADIPFEVRNNPDIQSLFTCLMKKEKFMDGQYSLTGSLSSSHPKKNFLTQIKGGFDFNAENGRIYKLTLLSRILSVLNVSNIFKGKIPNVLQKGFAYKQINIKADIKNSKIFLNRAVVDGNDMTMIFNGWIDPVKDRLELTCLVAPFKTIDLIIKHIPIINTMLNGRLVSVPVKASGKLSDPAVVILHPSAVGKGLVDMMSGILKTPVKLWDKLSGEKRPSNK